MLNLNFKNIIPYLLFFLFSLLISLPFILNFSLYGDYLNHIFLSSYSINNFKYFHYFPGLMNTKDVIGDPILIYYGVYLYPLLGFIGQYLGFSSSIAFLVFILNFIPFFCLSVFIPVIFIIDYILIHLLFNLMIFNLLNFLRFYHFNFGFLHFSFQLIFIHHLLFHL
jgi:hypothetical protein